MIFAIGAIKIREKIHATKKSCVKFIYIKYARIRTF